jgi:hypothetical protein
VAGGEEIIRHCFPAAQPCIGQGYAATAGHLCVSDSFKFYIDAAAGCGTL